MRKRSNRKVRPLALPPGLVPRLASSVVRKVQVMHWQNLEAITRGGARGQLLRDWTEGAFVWYRCAQLMREPEAEAALHDAVLLCNEMVNRYEETGRVGFSGPQLQRAREACRWMDAISAAATTKEADEAGRWSIPRLNAIFEELPA